MGIGRRTATAALVLSGLLAGACDGQARAGLDEERLGVMIDSLLPAISAASGLPVREPVRYAMQSRADARHFIEGELTEELGPAELAGMTRSYRLLGLIPDSLDLRALLLDLYTEQVVGYYDPGSERLYVVEGEPAAAAGPVVAHELVHALQDQHVDLDSLVARERGNDRQMAAQAAAEGQATLVMLALQAAESTGRTIDPGALPDLGTMIRPAMEEENERFPVFASAPRIVRETLLFPYFAGAEFLQALYRARRGAEVPVPFGDRLPQSTEQVLDPRGAFLADRDAPTEIELGEAPGDWRVVYSNTLGQFESTILLQEWTGDPGSAAAGWDGDRYALLEGPAGGVALVWYSVWDDAAAADAFVTAVRAGPGPSAARSAERLQVEGRELVRVVLGEGPVGALPAVTSLTEVQRR